MAQRPVDPGVAGDLGHGDGGVHLGPDPLHSGRGGLGQPHVRTVADGQERLFRFGAWPDGVLAGLFGRRPTEVFIIDLG